MRFHLSAKDQQAFILDSDRKQVHGPYYMKGALGTLIHAYERGELSNWTKTPARETKLLGLEQMHQLVEEHGGDLDPTPLLGMDPLPGWLVRWIRQKNGLSQGEMAEAVGSSSYRTVQDWELGQRNCAGPARLAVIGLLD